MLILALMPFAPVRAGQPRDLARILPPAVAFKVIRLPRRDQSFQHRAMRQRLIEVGAVLNRPCLP